MQDFAGHGKAERVHARALHASTKTAENPERLTSIAGSIPGLDHDGYRGNKSARYDVQALPCLRPAPTASTPAIALIKSNLGCLHLAAGHRDSVANLFRLKNEERSVPAFQ